MESEFDLELGSYSTAWQPSPEPMSTTRLSFEQLICESAIGGTEDSRDFNVHAFGSDAIRGARVADVLYVPELGLQVVAGQTVPLEAIQNPWRLKFELGRNFNGKADAYRGGFETSYRDEDVCILTNFYSRNFSIWITEELIKVAILERSGFTGRYVVGANLPGFAMQFLALLHVPEDRILRDVDGPTIFRSAVYVTAIRSLTMDRYGGPFFALRESLIEPAGTSSEPSRRLWMDRGVGVNNTGRELVNSEEVCGLLTRYGFEIVDMAALPVKDQIALANSAEVLSGPHGAAFVHAMFMQPGSTIIECFSPLFINTNWFGLLRVMGHRYFMIVHKQAHEPYPYGNRLMVDCAHLELTLQSLR